MNCFKDVTVGLRLVRLVILGVFQQHLRKDLKDLKGKYETKTTLLRHHRPILSWYLHKSLQESHMHIERHPDRPMAGPIEV